MSQQGLDQWFLRQDVIDQLLQSGDDDLEGINAYADRIMMIAQTEEAEHQTPVSYTHLRAHETDS